MIVKAPGWFVYCDNNCGATLNCMGQDSVSVMMDIRSDGWSGTYDGKVWCSNCTRDKVRAEDQDEDDFLNKPPAYIEPTTYGDATIVAQLRLAAKVWAPRSYVQNSDWTKVNENRRAKNLETIKNLIFWYEGKGFYTPKQRELEKLIKNAKAL